MPAAPFAAPTLRGRWRACRTDRAWRAAFAAGCRDISGGALGSGAIGLVVGVAMANSGVDLRLVLAMSLLVFASTSQLAALPLMAAGAPLWLIVATACVLNLRFVVFSAAWRTYLGGHRRGFRMLLAYLAGDPVYARFVQRYPRPPAGGRASRSQLGYFAGMALTNWAAWHASSLAGIVLADVVPAAWGLRFVGVLALLALALPALTDRAVRLSALVAAAVALGAAGLPMGLNTVAALLAALAAGLWADRRWGLPR